MMTEQNETIFSRLTPAQQAEQFANVRANEAEWRNKRRAEVRAAEDAKTAKQQAEREAALKTAALAEWTRNGGGDLTHFEAAWPGIRAEILKQRAAAAVNRKPNPRRVGF